MISWCVGDSVSTGLDSGVRGPVVAAVKGVRRLARNSWALLKSAVVAGYSLDWEYLRLNLGEVVLVLRVSIIRGTVSEDSCWM